MSRTRTPDQKYPHQYPQKDHNQRHRQPARSHVASEGPHHCFQNQLSLFVGTSLGCFWSKIVAECTKSTPNGLPRSCVCSKVVIFGLETKRDQYELHGFTKCEVDPQESHPMKYAGSGSRLSHSPTPPKRGTASILNPNWFCS